MFSRTWHGVTPIIHRDKFEEYEYETGIKDTLKVEGNQGSYLKVIEKGEYAHFFLCTFWDDMDSMKKYSGNNPEIAVDYPEDEKYNLISDPIVVIQKVITNENPFLSGHGCYENAFM